MLKLRLKRTGRKRSPSYRLVIMENTSRRDGRPIDEVGYYNPISKKYKFDGDKIKKWLSYGVQPTQTVFNLLKKLRLLVNSRKQCCFRELTNKSIYTDRRFEVSKI